MSSSLLFSIYLLSLLFLSCLCFVRRSVDASNSFYSDSINAINDGNSDINIDIDTANLIYDTIFDLFSQQRYIDMIKFTESDVLPKYQTLALPYRSSSTENHSEINGIDGGAISRQISLYSYLGIAYVGAGINHQHRAVDAFANATQHTPEDMYAWLNLGEVCMQTFQLMRAIEVFQHIQQHWASSTGNDRVLAKLVRAKAWTAHWNKFEQYVASLESSARHCHVVASQLLSDPSNGNSISTDELHRYGCALESSGGLEYTYCSRMYLSIDNQFYFTSRLVIIDDFDVPLSVKDVPGSMRLLFESMAPDSRPVAKSFPSSHVAPLWRMRSHKQFVRRALKVGILSSDFGVHPVSSLIRGLIQFIDKNKIDLYCLSLNPKPSWWSTNISSILGEHHFISVSGFNLDESAKLVLSYKFEILIDLNGHTLGSGVPLLAFRPARLQITYLGLPVSTGASFMDYVVGDPVALPAEHASHFSERTALLPLGMCYIVNDFAQMLGDVVFMSGKYRAPQGAHFFDQQYQQREKRQRSKHLSLSHSSSSQRRLLLATLSSALKIDPNVFHVWMNVMRTVPRTTLQLTTYEGGEGGFAKFVSMANYFGILSSLPTFAEQQCPFGAASACRSWDPTVSHEPLNRTQINSRLMEAALIPWINHHYSKTSIDLALDTIVKNGHTTGLDALWAGVPVVTLAGGAVMSSRAGESMHGAMESPFGVAISLKDYESIVEALLIPRKVRLESEDNNEAKIYSKEADITPWRLRALRDLTERKRLTTALFDTRAYAGSMESLLQGLWEVEHIASYATRLSKRNKHKQQAKKKQYHIFATGLKIDLVKTSYPSIDDRRIVVSQAYDPNGPPTEWLPTEMIRRTFVNRFGFDPGDPLSRSTASNAFQVEHNSGAVVDLTVSNQPHEILTAPVKSEVTLSSAPSSTTTSQLRPFHYVDDRVCRPYLNQPIPPSILNIQPLNLHIGVVPQEMPPTWVSVEDGLLEDYLAYVDNGSQNNRKKPPSTNYILRRRMSDFQGLPNKTVTTIYASHVLGRNSYGDSQVDATISEWHRVLKDEGMLLISVPDLATLLGMYLEPTITPEDRRMIILMLYGGQMHPFDYHKIGFDHDLLALFLQSNGFCYVRRIASLGLFPNDPSDMIYRDKAISLNVQVKKCGHPFTNADLMPFANWGGA